MANMYNIAPLSYQPTTNMDWFTQALFGGKLIDSGKIDVVTGIKESTLLNLINLEGSILQADSRNCAWTPEQILKLSEKELKIKTYKINLEQCLDDLERKRINVMLKPGAKNTELPESLEEATMSMLATELSSEIETKIFSGDSSVNSNDFDGAVKVLTNSTEAIKVVGVSLNKDNILDEIEKTYLSIPEAVLAKGLENGTLCFYVAYETLQRLRMALASVKNNNVIVAQNITIDESNIIRYLGVEFVPVKGLDGSTMIVADYTNFLLGTDLLSDTENIRLGQFPAPNDSKIFIDGRLRLGFVIPFENEVVFYSRNNLESRVATTYTSMEPKTYPVIDGIDQTPIHKLPTVGSIIDRINVSTSIDLIREILETESKNLRNSDNIKKAGEARITELSKTE